MIPRFLKLCRFKCKLRHYIKHGKLYLRHNTFADEIPIMIVLKVGRCSCSLTCSLTPG